MSEKEDLKKLLRAHDWYYHYSDSHAVWQRGSAEWTEILNYRDRVGKEVFDSLLEEYQPKNLTPLR